MADVDPQPLLATTTTRTGTVNLNVDYVTSFSGALKMCEILSGLIAWVCNASARFFATPSVFFLFVSVTSWILTIILFVIYFLALHVSTFARARWSVLEFGFNAFWALLYFIASCVLAGNAFGDPLLEAGVAFGFFTTIFYVAHAVISFKELRVSLL